MRASILVALASLAACSIDKGLNAFASTVVTVSDVAYAIGAQQTNSKEELLLLVKAASVKEPVVVNWFVRGGDESVRKLAQARATEIRKMLRTAGIEVSDIVVGNEVFEAKP